MMCVPTADKMPTTKATSHNDNVGIVDAAPYHTVVGGDQFVPKNHAVAVKVVFSF
jgi:hypothetical protein